MSAQPPAVLPSRERLFIVVHPIHDPVFESSFARFRSLLVLSWTEVLNCEDQFLERCFRAPHILILTTQLLGREFQKTLLARFMKLGAKTIQMSRNDSSVIQYLDAHCPKAIISIASKQNRVPEFLTKLLTTPRTKNERTVLNMKQFERYSPSVDNKIVFVAADTSELRRILFSSRSTETQRFLLWDRSDIARIQNARSGSKLPPIQAIVFSAGISPQLKEYLTETFQVSRNVPLEEVDTYKDLCDALRFLITWDPPEAPAAEDLVVPPESSSTLPRESSGSDEETPEIAVEHTESQESTENSQPFVWVVPADAKRWSVTKFVRENLASAESLASSREEFVETIYAYMREHGYPEITKEQIKNAIANGYYSLKQKKGENPAPTRTRPRKEKNAPPPPPEEPTALIEFSELLQEFEETMEQFGSIANQLIAHCKKMAAAETAAQAKVGALEQELAGLRKLQEIANLLKQI